MITWIFLFVLTFVQWPDAAFATDKHPTSSFTRLLEQTLENNPRIRAAQETLKATQALIPQAKSQLLPSLSFQWDNTFRSSQWHTGSSQSDPTSTSLSLSQPLFDLETLRDYQRLAPSIKAAQRDWEGIRQQVFLEFIELTANLLQGEDVYKLAENNYRLTQAHLTATTVRHDAGELTKTDVSQSRARVFAAKSEWIAAKADRQSNRARFVELSGQEAPEDIQLPILQHPLLAKPLSDLVAILDQRPDIEAARLRLQTAQGNIEARKAGYLPTAELSSSASRTFDPTSSSTSGPQDDTSLTLSLSWPLYSGGLTGAKIQEAVASRDSDQASLEQIHLAAIRELKVTLLELEKNEAVNQANIARGTAAKDALDGVSQEFEVGTRTSLDVLDAQNEFFSAQTEKVKSGYNLNLSGYRLLKVLGLLSLDKIDPSTLPANHLLSPPTTETKP
ncbi:MAG: TolC family outer membrane protein [Magnetococcus sp. THC-1_WYH]